MLGLEDLWTQVRRELAARPKDIDVRLLAKADWALHHRASPEVIHTLERQKWGHDVLWAWLEVHQFAKASALAIQYRSLHDFGWILFMQVRAGDVSGGLRTIEQIEDQQLKRRSMRGLIDPLVKQGQVEVAQKIAETGKWHLDLAEALVEIGSLERARPSIRKALETYQGDEYTQWVLEHILPLQIRAGDREEAKRNLERLSKQVEKHPNEVVRRYGLDWLVISYLLLPDIAAAKVLAERQPVEFGAQVQALCRVAVAQAQSGDTQGARQAFALAAQRLEGVKEAHEREAGFVRLATAQAEANERTTARASFARAFEIDSEQIQDYLESLAISEAELGFFPEAIRVLSALRDTRYIGVPEETVAIMQARAGDIGGARQTIARLGQRREGTAKPIALAKLGAVQAERGDRVGSRRTIREAIGIALRTPHPGVIWDILDTQASTGDYAGTIASRHFARARLRSHPKHLIGTNLIVALVKAGRIAEALRWVHAIPEAQDRLTALCESICQHLSRIPSVGH